MKSNFYFGSSDAPYPPTFPIVSPLPLPSFYPFSRNLLASSPSFSSIFPAFPSSVRISRARNVFATRPPSLLRSELRPHDLDYRKPGPCPFFLFFFSPPLSLFCSFFLFSLSLFLSSPLSPVRICVSP